MSLLTEKSLADQDIQECPVDYYLAREEITQALHILARRARNFALVPNANDFARHPSILLRGLKSLHVAFDKVA